MAALYPHARHERPQRRERPERVERVCRIWRPNAPPPHPAGRPLAVPPAQQFVPQTQLNKTLTGD